MLRVADPKPRAQAFYRKNGLFTDDTVKVEDGVREIRMIRAIDGADDLSRARTPLVDTWRSSAPVFRSCSMHHTREDRNRTLGSICRDWCAGRHRGTTATSRIAWNTRRCSHEPQHTMSKRRERAKLA